MQYAFGRPDLLGTYFIDLTAMFFAFPNALFPFWADQLGVPWALGLFYAAGTIGAVAITLTSKWTTTYRFHGRAVIWGAIGWGAAIALAGISNSLILVLIFLAAAFLRFFGAVFFAAATCYSYRNGSDPSPKPVRG